jgi:hypothetical protein
MGQTTGEGLGINGRIILKKYLTETTWGGLIGSG